MLTAMGDVMRRAYDKGWITTRDGNISLCRQNSKIMYITPSGWRKTILHPEHIMKVKFAPAGLIIQSNNPDVKPSGELEMHSYLQRHHKPCRAVVHLHPTNIIAAMFAGWDLQNLAAEFPEVSRYTRVGPTVPILPVTSYELASATHKAMTESSSNIVIYDIVGQKNHGVCAIGKNPWDAYEHIERLEHICEIALRSGKKPPVLGICAGVNQ
jgi:L-fuculose-phosphate aldolase